MSNVVQYSVLLRYDPVIIKKKKVFNINLTYWSLKMEAQVSARFSPQTSQELDDSTCHSDAKC